MEWQVKAAVETTNKAQIDISKQPSAEEDNEFTTTNQMLFKADQSKRPPEASNSSDRNGRSNNEIRVATTNRYSALEAVASTSEENGRKPP